MTIKNQTASQTPAIASFKNLIYMAYTTSDTPNYICLTSSDNGEIWDYPVSHLPAPTGRTDYMSSSLPISLVVFTIAGAECLCIVFRTNDDTNQMYLMYSSDITEWKLTHLSSINTLSGPSALVVDDTLYIAYNDNARLKIASSNDLSNWDTATIPMQFTASPLAPSITFWKNQFVVVYRGYDITQQNGDSLPNDNQIMVTYAYDVHYDWEHFTVTNQFSIAAPGVAIYNNFLCIVSKELEDLTSLKIGVFSSLSASDGYTVNVQNSSANSAPGIYSCNIQKADTADNFLIISYIQKDFLIAINVGQNLNSWNNPINLSSYQLYLAFTADPQFPWADAGQSSSDDDSRNRITAQYQSINNQAKNNSLFEGVIISGDITAYGHSDQLDSYKPLLELLNYNRYIGLGNHDYINNVQPGTSCALNNCSARMIHFLINQTENIPNASRDLVITNMSVNGNTYQYYDGSFAYSFNIGNLHIVQLNFTPVYSDNPWNAPTGYNTTEVFTIKSSMDWLNTDLSNARSRQDAIIICMHNYWLDTDMKPENKDYASTMWDTSAFNNLIQLYNVSAIFCGHVHSDCGFKQTVTGNQIPVFRCGAPTYSSYLWVCFDFQKNQFTVSFMNNNPNGVPALNSNWVFPLHN